MKGFFKFVGILVLIGLVYGAITEDNKKTTASQSQTSNVNKTEKAEKQKPEKLFRYQQCESEHSERYCYCLIGHVEKHLGFTDEMIWLNGGALDNAEGRKALLEAAVLCKDLDTGPAVKPQPIPKPQSVQKSDKTARNPVQTTSKQTAQRTVINAQQKHSTQVEQPVQKTEQQVVQISEPESEQKIIEEIQPEQQQVHKICNADVFYDLIKSPEKRSASDKEDFIKWDVKNIETINDGDREICKAEFSTLSFGKTNHAFFYETSDGQYELVPYQDRDANRTLQVVGEHLSNIDTAKKLIARGANVSYQPEDKSASFFLSAVQFGPADMVKLCLDNGANAKGVFEISSYDKGATKMTPLYMLITNDCMFTKNSPRCLQIVDMLLERGADPNVVVKYTDNSGQYKEASVMDWAFNVGIEVQKKLFDHGAKIVERPAGSMPLIMAMLVVPSKDLVEQLELWLSHGLNPNLPDTYNPYKPVYAITYAKENLSGDVVAVLEKYGASTTPYKVTDVKWCTNFDERALCGLFENTTQETLESVMVYFNLYDKDEIRIGEVVAYGLKIGPREKWKFATVGEIPNGTKSFKLRDVMAF